MSLYLLAIQADGGAETQFVKACDKYGFDGGVSRKF
jgi:hypothetical protein